MKLLVLDDDIDLMETLQRILRLHGHEADGTGDAREAVEWVARNQYDFVLVDYKMPGNNGIWFMENTCLPPKTRVLLITAYVNRAVIDRMFKLGASGYLIKPFDAGELLRSLRFFSGEERGSP